MRPWDIVISERIRRLQKRSQLVGNLASVCLIVKPILFTCGTGSFGSIAQISMSCTGHEGWNNGAGLSWLYAICWKYAVLNKNLCRAHRAEATGAHFCFRPSSPQWRIILYLFSIQWAGHAPCCPLAPRILQKRREMPSCLITSRRMGRDCRETCKQAVVTLVEHKLLCRNTRGGRNEQDKALVWNIR